MSAFTRLWFVLPGGDRAQLAGLAVALRTRPIAACASATEETTRATATALLSATADLHECSELDGSHEQVVRALGALASRWAELEVVVAGPRAALESALCEVLAVRIGSPSALAFRPAALYALDWPAESDAGQRPVLAGADLDWLPPWTSGARRARFPGGPGAAGTARG